MPTDVEDLELQAAGKQVELLPAQAGILVYVELFELAAEL